MKILIIDTGTSSMRAILMNKKGNILTKFQEKYDLSCKKGIIYEQDPIIFVNSLKKLIKNVISTGFKIDAIALTSQRSSVMPINDQGNPLYNFISWQDKRSNNICEEFNDMYGDLIHKICGCRLSHIMSAPKALWFKLNHPDLYTQTYKFLGIHDYLIYILTGNLVTDATTASRTALLDIKTKKWSFELFNIFQLDIEKFCDIVECGSIVGEVNESFYNLTGLSEGIPVITAGGDQQCSILGQGILESDTLGITLGSGCYVSTITNSLSASFNPNINITVATSDNNWILEANTVCTGVVYSWFNRYFYNESTNNNTFDEINNDIAATPIGANGVIALPYLSGKGCPSWDSDVRGAFYNLNLSSNKANCSRALLEGLASEVFECYELLKTISPSISNVYVCGGLSKSDSFNQMLSSMLLTTIKRINFEETTVIGAFLRAATSLKIFDDIKDGINFLKIKDSYKIFNPIRLEYDIYKRINTIRKELYNLIPSKQLLDFTEELSSTVKTNNLSV